MALGPCHGMSHSSCVEFQFLFPFLLLLLGLSDGEGTICYLFLYLEHLAHLITHSGNLGDV